MTARGRWFITPHAVRQFIARCGQRPAPTYEVALARLIEHSWTAKLRCTRDAGVLEFRGANPAKHLRFRVKMDGPGELPVLLTVLSSVKRA